MGRPAASLSTRAEQLWRALPLMTMVQAPQTSSRQPLSYTTGVVDLPSVVVGWAAMYCRQEITFIFGRRGTANSSHREGWPGPSCRRIRNVTVLSDDAGGRGSVVVGFIYHAL